MNGPAGKGWVAFGTIYLVLIWASSLLLPAAAAVALLATACSVAAFAGYGLDKRAARAGRRRMPEKSLHWIAFLGGWPGAAAAQTVWRHKTQKAAFQRAFRWTVAGNLALVAALVALAVLL